MRTIKLVLIAAFFATALLSQAKPHEPKSRSICQGLNITFDRAIQNHQLVVTMYAQLDPGFLGNYEKLYLVHINYKGIEYNILGSRQDFISFFQIRKFRKNRIIVFGVIEHGKH